MTRIWGDCHYCNAPTQLLVEEPPERVICESCNEKQIRKDERARCAAIIQKRLDDQLHFDEWDLLAQIKTEIES